MWNCECDIGQTCWTDAFDGHKKWHPIPWNDPFIIISRFSLPFPQISVFSHDNYGKITENFSILSPNSEKFPYSGPGCLKKLSVLQAQLRDHLVLRTILLFSFSGMHIDHDSWAFFGKKKIILFVLRAELAILATFRHPCSGPHFLNKTLKFSNSWQTCFAMATNDNNMVTRKAFTCIGKNSHRVWGPEPVKN